MKNRADFRNYTITIKATVLGLFAAMALAGCEQVLPLDVPPYTSKLNLNALLIAGDDLAFPQVSLKSDYQTTITASNTVGAFTADRIKFLKDTKIEFITDNNFVEVLAPVNLGLRFSRQETFDTIWGFLPTSSLAARRYEVRAMHPDYDGPVIGSQVLPARPNAQELGRADGTETRLRIRLQDNAGPQQYLVRVYGFDLASLTSESVVLFSCVTPGFSTLSQFDDFDFEDPSGLPVTYQGLLSDRGFDGQTVDLELIVYSGWTNVRLQYVVELLSVTANFETYLRAFYRNQNNEFNPFSEPISIYQNVTGGGVGTVLGGTRRTLVFP